VYPNYFGLKEPSFSITPDPQYLFLSGQHREALAHLLYGAGENGGFVLLSGEVGTGKTMVCRAFLEQLPDGVDVALVVNPAMTAAELLHAVCDEFRLQLPPGEPSVKVMLDHLNSFLLDAHARGRRPVLIIDEAQNLRPKVLEQIRLLTNLETAKRKLLQIFLIGQPELRTLLASPELRQLNQRITARYHLKPLSVRETAAYIDHRIAVAGVDRPLFTPKALKRVHRCTGGVPRLINLLCDRALLGAAVSRRMQVTPDIVEASAREVVDRADPALPRRRSPLGAAAAMITTLALGVWLGASDLPRQVAGHLPAEWAATLGWPAPADGAAESAPPVRGLAEAQPAPDDEAQARRSPEDGSPSNGGSGADALAGAGDVTPEPPATSPVAAASVIGTGPALAEEAKDTGAEAMVAGDPEPDPAPVAVANTPAVPAAADPAAALPAPVEDASAAPPEPEAETAPVGVPRTPRIAATRLASPPRVATLDADSLGDALVAEDAVVDELLRLWRVETAPGVRHLDCAAAPAFALACERGQGRWSDLRRFDRPTALKLSLPEDKTGFVVVGGIDDEHALLYRDGGPLRVPIALLDERWSGDYLLLWRPPPFGSRVIGVGTAADAVAWLRERLALLPGSDLTVDPARYDADVRAAVRSFQGAQGLASDGVAGPHTLIMLSNALADLDVPRLSHSR
jgi:general secretion pathway protein A